MADDEKPAQTPEDRLAALEKRLSDAEAKNAVYETTLKALNPKHEEPARDDGQSYTYPPLGIDPNIRTRIKNRLARLGFDDTMIDNHWEIIGAFLGEMAQPMAQAIGQLADRTDYVKTRLTRDDYKEIEAECEEEFSKRLRSGRPTSREEIYQMVKARPEIMARKIDEKVQEKMKEREAQTAQVNAAETEGASSGGQAKPGEHALAGGKELTPDQFLQLSLEDKEKYLEGKPF